MLQFEQLKSSITYGNKYKFILLLFLLGSLNGYSQTEKNTFTLGGRGSISFTSSSYNYFSISADPGTGYFIVDNLYLGLSMPVTYIHTSYHDDFMWYFDPNVRYYINIKDLRRLFVSTSVGIKIMDSSNFNLGFNNVRVGVGYLWFLNKSFGFGPQIVGSTDFRREINVGLYFGFHAYFNKNY